jgi:glucose/arabinose dehydrogenase
MTPSIAPSGIACYPPNTSGDMFPQFKEHLLVCSLKFRRLYLVELGSEAENSGLPKSERVIIDGDIGRIRDVAVAPHGPFAGSIMLLSDEAQGGLFMARQK